MAEEEEAAAAEIFSCNECEDKKYTILEDLQQHTTIHYKFKFSCTECGFITIDRKMHDQHYTSEHIPSSQKGQRKKVKAPLPNKTAIKMYKLVPEERYVLWVICRIEVQVFGSVESDRLLNLMELLFNKHNTNHVLKEPEAILMYISVLEQRAKYKDALAILSGVLGALILLEVHRLHIKGGLLACACDYAKVVEVFVKVLEAWFTADTRWANQPSSKDMEKMKRDLDLAIHASLFRYLERKLYLNKMEAAKKCTLKPMTWKTRIKIPMMKIEEAADLKQI